jgi:hypothetical protein
MNPMIYYLVTFILYAIEVLLALAAIKFKIPISDIFGIIATFAGNGLSFFIPSLFVILGFKKFAEPKYL